MDKVVNLESAHRSEIQSRLKELVSSIKNTALDAPGRRALLDEYISVTVEASAIETISQINESYEGKPLEDRKFLSLSTLQNTVDSLDYYLISESNLLPQLAMLTEEELLEVKETVYKTAYGIVMNYQPAN